MYDRLKRLYEGRRLDADGIVRAVSLGWITQEEADEIMGVNNEVPDIPTDEV